MKARYSIFAISFSICCIIYLLLPPQRGNSAVSIFSAKALTKEIVSENHSTLSDSFILSPDQIYQKKLSAHTVFYGSVSSPKDITIKITSKAIQTLEIILLSDTEKKLSYNTRLSDHTYTLSFSGNSSNYSQRIFLKIWNKSTASHSFQIKLLTELEHTEKLAKNKSHKTKNATSNSTHQTSAAVEHKNRKFQKKTITKKDSSVNTNKIRTTSNPKSPTVKKQKLSTIQKQKVVLNPQFLLAKPNSVHKLTAKVGNKDCSLSDFTILSSNSSVAVVKNNEIHALQSGIAILYLQHKQKSQNSCSCFIRVM